MNTLLSIFNSQSSKMRDLLSVIERVAATEFPVLVRGESGSGKELVARAIHDHSSRKHKPFIAINCAALNANILESELFGHEKGAFTGAIRDHKGVFERAEGGTLFLDEIAEIPLELQAKLLRVLESGEFTRLGGERLIKANVRIITATHRALREEAKAGRFRQDLLYRLRVIPIFVPPLRDRKSDIPLLVKKILRENMVNGQASQFSNEAMQVLMGYDWPGNVRELKNTILYALTMSLPEKVIDVQHLPHDIVFLEDKVDENGEEIVEITAQVLKDTLDKHQQNLTLVAKELQMSRTTLWRYRKKFQV
jgi:transcriptional regulator with PAS, ATPase and Fis domain